MLPFLGLCPPLTLTILTLGSSVPAMALGPLISTSWLFGRHWPSLRGREIEPKDLICLVFLVFLSVPASRASGVALLERKGASQGWKTRGVCLLGCSTLGCEMSYKDKQTSCSARLGHQARLMPRKPGCQGSNQSRISNLSS